MLIIQSSILNTHITRFTNARHKIYTAYNFHKAPNYTITDKIFDIRVSGEETRRFRKISFSYAINETNALYADPLTDSC